MSIPNTLPFFSCILLIGFVFLAVDLSAQVNCVPFSFNDRESILDDDFDSGHLDQWMVIDENDNVVSLQSFGWTIATDDEINCLEDPDINYSKYSLRYSPGKSSVATTLLSPVIDLMKLDKPGFLFYAKSSKGLDNIEVFVRCGGEKTIVFPPEKTILGFRPKSTSTSIFASRSDSNPPDTFLPKWCECNDTWTGQYVNLDKYQKEEIQIEIVPQLMPGESLALDHMKVSGGSPNSFTLSSSGLVVLGMVLMLLGAMRI